MRTCPRNRKLTAVSFSPLTVGAAVGRAGGDGQAAAVPRCTARDGRRARNQSDSLTAKQAAGASCGLVGGRVLITRFFYRPDPERLNGAEGQGR
jgi:hypothetical protein